MSPIMEAAIKKLITGNRTKEIPKEECLHVYHDFLEEREIIVVIYPDQKYDIYGYTENNNSFARIGGSACHSRNEIYLASLTSKTIRFLGNI